MSDRFVCPSSNKIIFFPFYQTFTNWLMMPNECRFLKDPKTPVYIKKNNMKKGLFEGHKHQKQIFILIFFMILLSVVGVGIIVVYLYIKYKNK